ncbi:MAG: HesB/IscA family protein [Leptolyngbyaceae cyanobacterium]
MIQLSAAAVEELKRLQANLAPEQSAVRLVAMEGGCAGLQYDFHFAAMAESSDRSIEIDGLIVLTSPDTLSRCEGVSIDYSEDLMGGNFRFTNPLAQQTCSCGVSFSLEASAKPLTEDCTTA